MHLLHFGIYIELLYPYVKHGLKANTGVKNEADFTFELLGIIETDAVYDMSASAASRYKKGRRALPEDIASSFRKDGVRDTVIHEMGSKYVPRIDRGRKQQLIKEFLNIVKQDTTIDDEFKATLSEEAVPERLAHFLADLLIYSVGIDPTERDKEYPVENYNLPMNNDWFTGRSKELGMLADNFADGCRMQILYGMGGMGKSQIARKYAYDHYRSYSLMHWVNAHTMDSIVECYRTFLREKKVEPSEQTREGICQSYTKYMDSHSDWLIVYDNCNYYTDKEYADFVNLCLPKNRSVGNILITSRNKRPIGKAKRIRVDILPDVDAVSFLLQRTESEDAAGAGQLAERLGRFPLALEIAGAYIYATTGCDFQTYLGYLEEEIKILDRMVEVTDYTETIKGLLLLTMKRIQKDRNNDQMSLCVEDTLHLCAYGAPYSIDIRAFSFLPLDESEPIGPMDELDIGKARLEAVKNICADTLQRNELTHTLITYGLAMEQPDGLLSMHELLLEVLSDYIFLQTDWSYIANHALNSFVETGGGTYLYYFQHVAYFFNFWEKRQRRGGASESELAFFALQRRTTHISLLIYEFTAMVMDHVNIKTVELLERDLLIRQDIQDAVEIYEEINDDNLDIENLELLIDCFIQAMHFFRNPLLYASATTTVYYALHVLYLAFVRWGEDAVITESLRIPDDRGGFLGSLLAEIRECLLLALSIGEKCHLFLKLYLKQSHAFITTYAERMHWDKTELTDYLMIMEAYIAGDPNMLPKSVELKNIKAVPGLTEYLKKIDEYYRNDPNMLPDIATDGLNV